MATWIRIKELGRGGNGTVYEVEGEDGSRFAMKAIQRARNGKAYKRFRDEIEVLQKLKNEPGIMQIVDHYLPEIITDKDPPYYVMPLATRFRDHIENIDDAEFYSLFLQLCQTLIVLHGQGITHRDIKPDNILMLNGSPVFADFGLANFPKKRKISHKNEKIGPRWTIAPEMERISSVAEFKKADIYSFGKTLWMLVTKQWFGFEGQYIPDSSISVNSHVKIYINESTQAGQWYYRSTVLLDQLLVDATDNNPANRPDAETFFEELKFWFESNDEYPQRNPYEWIHAIKHIFPVSIPISSAWEDLNDIVEILKVLSCKYDNLNHSFYPGSGGLDITNVNLAQEDGCLILNHWEILKPKRLTFEFVGDLHWSYFRLELNQLPKLNSQYADENSEEIFIDADGNYQIVDDYDKTNAFRWYKGIFLIARKRSPINMINGEYSAYNGHHDNLSGDDYRDFIRRLMLLSEQGKLDTSR